MIYTISSDLISHVARIYVICSLSSPYAVRSRPSHPHKASADVLMKSLAITKMMSVTLLERCPTCLGRNLYAISVGLIEVHIALSSQALFPRMMGDSTRRGRKRVTSLSAILPDIVRGAPPISPVRLMLGMQSLRGRVPESCSSSLVNSIPRKST